MKMLDALLILKEKAISGSVNEPRCGICYNLSNITEEINVSYEFIRNNCEDWEYFSGDSTYPVNDYDGEPLWEGKRLVLRLSLLDHLIAKAKLLQV